MANNCSQKTRQKDKWNPSLYEDKHNYQLSYGTSVIDELLIPQEDELILDMGCGTGQLTNIIAERGAKVIGIDCSAQMIKKAQENFPEIQFFNYDARDFSFPFKFDAVFSHATLHWICEQDRVVQSVARALKTGGRLAIQFSGKKSMAIISEAAIESIKEITGAKDVRINLFTPSLGEFASLLEKFGFEVSTASLQEHPTPLPDGSMGLANWTNVFMPVLFPDISQEILQKAADLMKGKLKPKIYKNGTWYADYRRIRVQAVKVQEIGI